MQGGKGSTASRRTYRELAPSHAAGKVPVLGAESAGGEPQGSKLVADGEALVELAMRWDRSQQHSHAVSAQL